MVQRKAQQPKQANLQPTRTPPAVEAQATALDATPAEPLQRTIGNQAMGALLDGRAAQPSISASAGINAIIQRHPIKNGVHTEHGPKDARHTISDAEAALKEAQEEWARVEPEVALKVVPSRLSKTNLVVPKLTATRKYIQARLDLAMASPSAKIRRSIREVLAEVDKRSELVNTRVDTVDRAEGYDDALTLANSAPTLLTRVEANARAGAEAVKLAAIATSGKEAKSQLDELKRDLSGAAGLTERIASIEAGVARHANLVSLVQPHKVAAEAAVQALRASVPTVTRIFAALKALDGARNALDATRRLAARVDAAEEKVRELEAMLAYEQEYTREFEATLKGIDRSFAGGATSESMMTERREYIAAVVEARDQALRELQAARDAVARIPAEEEAVTKAHQVAAASVVGAQATANAAITRIEDLQALRQLAGGQATLAKLQASIPDNPKLKGLLEALGSKLLQAWLADGGIGSAKTIALYDAFTGDGLKKFIADIGADKRDAVVRGLTAPVLVDIHDDAKLGVPKFVELLARYQVDGVVKMIASMTLLKVKALTDQFTDTELGKSKLTADQLVDLHTKFTAVKLKHWYTTFGPASIEDFLTLYPAATLDAFITAVGEPRFEVLVRDKKLKANVLHHYGATFLKDFTGVDAAAMHHLRTPVIRYNDDGNGNRISGGHDPIAFNAALNNIITPAVAPVKNGKVVVTPGRSPVRAGRSFNPVAVGTECTKVQYDLHNYDGTVLGSGEKTLINTLVAQQAMWQQRAEEAIWNSIKAMNCNTATRRWNGSAVNGFAFSGYLAMDLKSVATFYPT